MSRKRRKRRSSGKEWLVYIGLASILVLLYLLTGQYRRSLSDDLWAVNSNPISAFGIDMPINYNVHGIDISSYQGKVNWAEVKKMSNKDVKISFVFIKATEGVSDCDKMFAQNWQQTKANHLIRGAYHYFIATKSGSEQAWHFIKTVRLQKGDLPPVLDVEHLHGVSPVILRQRVQECLNILEGYYHVKPVIYSYADFYNRNLGKDFDEYPLWVAHYFELVNPRIQRDWTFWQHSQQGRIPGIPIHVDFNVFKGSMHQFKKLLLR